MNSFCLPIFSPQFLFLSAVWTNNKFTVHLFQSVLKKLRNMAQTVNPVLGIEPNRSIRKHAFQLHTYRRRTLCAHCKQTLVKLGYRCKSMFASFIYLLSRHTTYKRRLHETRPVLIKPDCMSRITATTVCLCHKQGRKQWNNCLKVIFPTSKYLQHAATPQCET